MNPKRVTPSRLPAALAGAAFLCFPGAVRLHAAAYAAAAAADSAVVPSVTNVFAAAPSQWTAVIGGYAPAAMSLTPIILSMQARGYSVAVDPVLRRPALLKDGLPASPAAVAGDAELARHDSIQTVRDVARGLSAPQDGARTEPQLLEDSAKLRLLESSGLSPYLTDRDRAAVAEAYERSSARLSAENRSKIPGRMTEIAAALGRTAEIDGAGPAAAASAGAERIHASGLARHEYRDRAARAEPPELAPPARGEWETKISRFARRVAAFFSRDDRLARHQKAVDYAELHAEKWINEQKCVSCHTVLPYALGRMASPSGSRGPASEVVTRYIDGRLDQWGSRAAWYPEQARASDSTELILSFFTLSQLENARLAEPTGRSARAAALMAGYQEPDGGFPWLDFGLQPFESKEAALFGSSLAAIAFSSMKPAELSRYGENVGKLKSYLRKSWDGARGNDFDRLTVAWAASAVPGIVGRPEIEAMMRGAAGKQAADGGWSISSLSNWEKAGVARETSDAFATAYLLFVMKKAGLSRSPQFAGVYARGVGWLKSHQEKTGEWAGTSLNSRAAFNKGLATDMATGFAAAVLGEN